MTANISVGGGMMSKYTQDTMSFKKSSEETNETRRVLVEVFTALEEKGYNPI
ncbi:MAG TPA: hypothetical protein DG577_06180, partial [Firmicutes bacterium]|nr:hypothetical protein [Bacillota bacterium]